MSDINLACSDLPRLIEIFTNKPITNQNVTRQQFLNLAESV